MKNLRYKLFTVPRTQVTKSIEANTMFDKIRYKIFKNVWAEVNTRIWSSIHYPICKKMEFENNFNGEKTDNK